MQVTFSDVVAYRGDAHAVFAGRYTAPGGGTIPLEIRTSRYFRYEDGYWRQYHHHGGIDDGRYQQAVRG